MLIDINKLLEQGEGLNCEFKSSFTKDIAQALCAFANTKGGAVVIGVKDDGTPIGVNLNKETLQVWVNEIKQNTYPTIIADTYDFNINGKTIVVLSIDEFPVKPVSARGRYYKRIRNSNHQMSLSEVSNMHIKTFNSSWDYYEDPNHTLDDISLDKVNSFIEKANKYRLNKITDDPLTILKKYELLKNDKITNAAYLLFAKNYTLPTCIEIGRFSNDRITIKDALTLRSDIFNEVEDLMSFILKHINKRYEFTGAIQREEIWDYPIDALREIIVNMVVHRDYMHHGDSSVKIYDDRIEFFNPGHFPPEITSEKLKTNEYTSDCRNKQIAAMFKDSHDMEKYGTGIYRVTQKFNQHGLVAPIFENFQHGIRVIVLSDLLNDRKVTHKQEKVTHKQEKVTHKQEKVTHKQEKVTHKSKDKILLLLKENPLLQREDLMKELSLTMSGIKKHLQELQAQKRLTREGSRKTGKWVVVDDDC